MHTHFTTYTHLHHSLALFPSTPVSCKAARVLQKFGGLNWLAAKGAGFHWLGTWVGGGAGDTALLSPGGAQSESMGTGPGGRVGRLLHEPQKDNF